MKREILLARSSGESRGAVLTDGVLTGDPDALAALDRAAESARRNSPLVRIKLWDATGRIVWSDEPLLIGEPFGLDDDERDALRDGNTLAEVSDLSAPENRYERPPPSPLFR